MGCTFAVVCWLLALPSAQIAEPVMLWSCASYERVTEPLKVEFGEELRARARSSRGWVIEMWANVRTGTWTLVRVMTPDCAHVVEGGDFWMSFDNLGEGA